MPVLPQLSFLCVDVRDVAAAHLAAMTIPEAAGKRHIISATNLWLADIAEIIHSEFKPQGYKVPTRVAPYAFLWLFARFDETIRLLLPWVGKVIKLDNSRMLNVLGVSPRDIRGGQYWTCATA